VTAQPGSPPDRSPRDHNNYLKVSPRHVFDVRREDPTFPQPVRVYDDGRVA
jgi:hypothetical protein